MMDPTSLPGLPGQFKHFKNAEGPDRQTDRQNQPTDAYKYMHFDVSVFLPHPNPNTVSFIFERRVRSFTLFVSVLRIQTLVFHPCAINFSALNRAAMAKMLKGVQPTSKELEEAKQF